MDLERVFFEKFLNQERAQEMIRNSHPEVFLGKGVQHNPCQSVISIKFLKQLY